MHFAVQAPSTLAAPVNGRLLLFLKAGHGDTAVDTGEMNPAATWVGAREVHDLTAGATIEIDPDAENIAFPTPFASIPTGDYEVQAVLDVDHSYNYTRPQHPGLGEPSGDAGALDAGRGRGAGAAADRARGRESAARRRVGQGGGRGEGHPRAWRRWRRWRARC